MRAFADAPVAFAIAHADTAYFFENDKGPSLYWGGGLGIGFTYDLSGPQDGAR